MKKLLKVLCVLMSVLVVLSFVSCTKGGAPSSEVSKPFEPTDAVSLWNKIDETMSDMDSYEVNTVIKMGFFISGSKVNMTGNSVGLICKSEDNYYSYSYAKMETTCEKPKINETFETLEAYYDGKMYVYKKDSNYEQKLCSKITVDDFRAYGAESNIFKDIDLADCKDPEFSKNEDGTYNLKFSGYTKKTVNILLEDMELPEEEIGADILDVEISIITDTEFRSKTMEFKFIFEEGEDALDTPEFTVTEEYSKFNEAVPNPEDIKTEDYVEVDDVRVLKKIDDGIKNIQNATSGKFDLNIKQNISISGEDSSITEKDTVTYGVTNGNYYYNLKLQSGNINATIDYSMGNRIVKVTGYETETSRQTEDEAKEYINGLINAANFAGNYVSKVTRIDGGAYEFKMGYIESSIYKEYFESLGLKYNSTSQELTVYSEGDRISRIESKVRVKGAYGGKDAIMIVDSTVIFKDVKTADVEM